MTGFLSILLFLDFCPLDCKHGGRCEIILVDQEESLAAYNCLCMEDYTGPKCEYHMEKHNAGKPIMSVHIAMPNMCNVIRAEKIYKNFICVFSLYICWTVCIIYNLKVYVFMVSRLGKVLSGTRCLMDRCYMR